MSEINIELGINHLCSVDEDVADAIKLIGPPAPRVRPVGFETFLNTIVSQQISTEAARTIMGRVKELLVETSAERVLETDADELRSVGLSYRKIEYAKGLSEAVLNGKLDIDALSGTDNESAIEQIMALRGFGRWSAEIYLMFSLQRADIFPADDLALRVALGRLKGMQDKPTPKQSRDMIEHWAPWRSVGSLFLWHYYRGAPN